MTDTKTYCIIDVEDNDVRGIDFSKEEVVTEARELCAFLYKETRYAPQTFEEAIKFFDEEDIMVFDMNDRIKS